MKSLLENILPIKLNFISLKSKRKTPGLAPGTLVYTGKFEKDTKFTSYLYDKKELIKTDNSLNKLKKKGSKTWVNIVGLNDIEKIKEISSKLGIDNLTLEDILNADQRPKVEFNKDSIFVVLRMYFYNSKSELHSEQISIIMKNDLVVTFQECEDDVFDPIRERLSRGTSLLRSTTSSYLFYAILDLVIDHYLLVIDSLSEKIDDIDDELSQGFRKELAFQIYSLRNLTALLRRKIYPVKEVVNQILRIDNKLLHKDTLKYMRDLYDHSISVNEGLDTQRETLSDLLSLYHTHMNNKMNETMKVLTVIATIFIPLSFIVGVYGMNFDYMPELAWKYGYFGVWGLILLIFSSMIFYFKKKEWI